MFNTLFSFENKRLVIVYTNRLFLFFVNTLIVCLICVFYVSIFLINFNLYTLKKPKKLQHKKKCCKK